MDVTNRKLSALSLAGLLFSLTLAGCVSSTVRPPSLSWFDGPSHGSVNRLVSLWADGVIAQPDRVTGAPTPGFSGRLYLFGADPGSTLAADGAIHICLFNKADPRGPDAAPCEVWDLREKDLKLMLKKDGVGWGYNLWLPWTTCSPDITHVAIRIQYLPKSGMPIWTETNEIVVNQPERGIKVESRTVPSARGNLPTNMAVR
jgi:hypothetical protein